MAHAWISINLLVFGMPGNARMLAGTLEEIKAVSDPTPALKTHMIWNRANHFRTNKAQNKTKHQK